MTRADDSASPEDDTTMPEIVHIVEWHGVRGERHTGLDGATLDAETHLHGYLTDDGVGFAVPPVSSLELDPETCGVVPTPPSTAHEGAAQHIDWHDTSLERYEPLDGCTLDGDIELIGYRDSLTGDLIAVPFDHYWIEQANRTRETRERISALRHPANPDIPLPPDDQPPPFDH